MLTREGYITQPFSLVLRALNPSVLGNKVVAVVMSRLDLAFKEMITAHNKGTDWQQLSIFATEDVKKKYLGDNKLTFDIHMKEIVTDPKNYQAAFNAVCNVADITIWAPIEQKDGVAKLVRTPLFTLVMEANVQMEENPVTGETVYRYERFTQPVVGLAIEKSVAEYVLSLEKGYSEIQLHPVLESSDKYFYPIYAFLARYKNNNPPEIVIGYDDFRCLLNLDKIANDKLKGEKEIIAECKAKGLSEEETQVLLKKNTRYYILYTDFHKRILKPCMEEMKEYAENDEVDIWFEVEKIYHHGRATNPDELKFIIHHSELGKRLLADKESTKEVMAMEERLLKEFKQTKTQVRKIMKEAMKFRKELARKMDELSAAREAGKIKIDSDEGAYWNVAITNFIEKTRMAHEGEKLQFAEAEIIVDAAPAQQAQQAPKADTMEERWGRVMRQWRQMITAAEWRQMFDHSSAIRPLWFEDGALTLGVPDKNYYGYFCEKYYAAMKPLIMEVFGEVAVKFDYIR